MGFRTAALAGDVGCSATATGMAAAASVMLLSSSGDHVVTGTEIYGGTCRLSDHIMTVAYNTILSHCFQRPTSLGVDIAIHSTTKYINGHSDIGGSAIVHRTKELEGRDRRVNAIATAQAPYNSRLALRGVKTLAPHMEMHQKNARAIAEYLEAHPRVKRVYYAGLASHPQRDRISVGKVNCGRRQTSDFCKAYSSLKRNVFEEVQRIMAGNNTRARRRIAARRNYLLSGILRRGGRGEKMQGKSARSPNGAVYFFVSDHFDVGT